ncbi:MAG: ATP-binding cassette domain-containing protein [Planctomycetes bacterium]|nr:ATP-binding cassette domain-containing protein [Planctomycetota bacterium]
MIFDAKNISVAAGGRTLLEGVELRMDKGDLFVLSGQSGAGKTTLLRVLAWLDLPQAGEIEFEGKSPLEWGVNNYRRKVVYVSQRAAMMDESVENNLRRVFRYASAGKGFDRDRAVSLLEKLGVEPERMGQDARSLSEGQQQRVSLARALMLEPEILLLDEPTGSLDPDTVGMVEEYLVGEVAKRSFAILVVSHDPGQAGRLGAKKIELASWLVSNGGGGA